ncbi:hypothetical protein [uncultured Methylibium sp.]|uniref:hypothetical protein n=1 Tax=uncultured Methylibium sp. TaxID=381093 RepID=UPI0025E90BDA|nr:hypothetical protein [uncultured Methylibium sp.]
MFAYWQYDFSKTSSERQEKIAEDSARETAKQTDRLIAAAERLTALGAEANDGQQRSLQQSIDSAKQSFEAAIDGQRQVATLVASAQEAFAAQSLPVVRFSTYQWFSQSANRPISCDHGASGINAYFENVSAVPVYIRGIQTNLLLGSRPVFSESVKALGNVCTTRRAVQFGAT